MLKVKKITAIFILCLFSASHINGVRGRNLNEGENPFSPKAYIHRYWQKQISNGLPAPKFLLNDKASPLTAVETAKFIQLAEQNILSAHLPSFCSAANLLCLPQDYNENDSSNIFNTYTEDRNFTNYEPDIEGTNSFSNYSNDENVVIDSFRRYSRGGSTNLDKFTTYANNSNVATQDFASYGVSSVVGAGEFTNYNPNVNSPHLTFTTYSTDTFGKKQSFTSYTNNSNSGDETFTNYGDKASASKDDFTSYGKDSNVIESSFSSYNQQGVAPNETFTSYGSNGNVPQNKFNSYGDTAFANTDTFKSYRDHDNGGDDSFQSYAKKSQDAAGAASNVKFSSYGHNSLNEGSDTFKGYGEGSPAGQAITGFKVYGVNTTFKAYSKDGVTFSKYNQTLPKSVKDKMVNKWRVEPGKFFREKMLEVGTVMPMPDIADKMPKRSFLPRVILGKIPFTTSKLEELKKIFQARDNSSMAGIISSALSECERAPSPGETKRCVGSIEDMIDFAITVLGRNVVPKITENTDGSKQDVMIGSIKKINGGKITKSVSCHQSLYPYLLYYCHSVPKVRVYEADLMDPKSKAKINHGVAICHVDTSVWSANHGAFVALGSGPGKIEVCHWIFENDMTWVIAD